MTIRTGIALDDDHGAALRAVTGAPELLLIVRRP